MIAMIRVPRQKTEELKGMIKEGLHIFGRAMSLAEDMCEDAEMGERGGNYNMRGGDYGMREMDYPYGDRMSMGMREGFDNMGERYYPQSPMMGERQGVRGTGRYSMYR